jgi:hypothetical protein
MAKKELEDPVDAGGGIKEEEFDTLDISNIKVEALPDEAARVVLPFDGYPLKKAKNRFLDVTDEEGNKRQMPYYLSFVVLHNHVADPLRQDKSGGKKFKSFHMRSIPDVLNGNTSNIAVQYSIPFETASGVFYGAYVPDHYVRAQMVFKYNGKAKRIEVDKRYILLDREQAGRLKQCFQQIINPKIQMEKAADYVSGASNEEPSEMTEKDYGSL